MMKVLWFTNTPSLGEEYLDNTSMNGGFLKSIEKAMQDKVELSVAFYYHKPIMPFKHGYTNYFPIFKDSNNVFSKIRNRVFNLIEPEGDVNKFLKIIEEVKPDLIHFHGTEGPFGLVQKVTKIPCVISIQGNISVYELKYFSGIPLIDVYKYTSLKSRMFFTRKVNNFNRFKKQSKREKRIFKLSKNIIGRTDWDRRISKILSPNARYFHNDEILKDVFYEGLWENKLGDCLQLFTTTGGNIYKGIETLIFCAHLLDSLNLNYTWKVAGIGINDEIIRLVTKGKRLNFSKNIEFLGKLDDQKLKRLILNCNIYLAISHIENSPNSLCEALILGAPCISTYVGGTSNFIEDKISGILIQDGDPYSMAGSILELKENYDLALKYGANARKSAIERHDKKIIASDLLNIYKKILEK